MITLQTHQAQRRKAPGRYLFRPLALLLCGLSLLGQAGVGVALPTTQAAPRKTLLAYSVSGTVFDDYNQNGAQESREPGLNGVTVSAYNSANTLVTSTNTATTTQQGVYTLNIPNGTGSVRVEFTNFGPGSSNANLKDFVVSNHAGGTEEAFVSGLSATNTVNLGLEIPTEYCQNNPNVAVSCFTKGDQTNIAPALVRFPYSNAGDTTPPDDLANAPNIGTTFGLAYRSSTNNLFAAAFMRRHAGFKPSGSPGAIYIINNADAGSHSVSPTPFFDFNNPAFGNAFLAGLDQHTPGSDNYQLDASSFDAVGKFSLGGMALSNDQQTLYVMNLYDKKLYAISIGATNADPVAGTFAGNNLPRPDGCAEGDFRPFAVATYRNDEYVGAVCSAQSTVTGSAPQGDPSKLEAYVYKFTPGTGFVSTPVLQFALNYPRRCANHASSPTCAVSYPAIWHPWISTYQYTGETAYPNYPQPMLTGIAFDRGDMLLGLRDRFGDQTGYNTPVPDNSHSIHGIASGDLLRACLSTPEDSSGGWTLENNASCGGVTTLGANNTQGPGNGEYYYQDNYSVDHDHVALGSVLQVPGFTGNMATVFDPTDTVFSGGVRTYDNSDGTQATSYRIYGPTDANTFGKANGLGGIAAFCHAAPVEIGHRLWLDSNGNGIQDSNEPPIVGATVNLYAANGTTLSQTTTTDSNGVYYFSNLTPYVNYVIKVNNPNDYLPGHVLAGNLLTAPNLGSILANSKALLPNSSSPMGTGNYPQISITAPQPGVNLQNYDIGFVPAPDLSITKTHPAASYYTVGQNVTFTLTVTNSDGAGPVANGPITVIDSIPTGLKNITVTGSGWSFSSVVGVSVKFAHASRQRKILPRQAKAISKSLLKAHAKLDSVPDSPSTITATYTGPFPVPVGATLPTITVTGTLTSSAVSSLLNQASVAVQGDINTANNTTTNTVTPVEPAPDFSLAMTHSNIGCVIIGSTASFTLTATNNSSSTISTGTVGAITITDTLPADLSAVSSTSPNWTTNVSGTTLTATFVGSVSLSPGQALPPLTISGTVSSTATTTLNNTATINIPYDSNPTNDTANDSISVCPRPDLSIVKSHTGTGPFQVGQSVAYTLNVSNVSNLGSVAINQSIIVTDSIPPGLTNVLASGSNWAITKTSNQITATYSGPYPVTPGTNMSPINIIGTLTSSAIGSLDNTATVSTPLDNNSGNDTSSNTLTVGPGPDLAITKTHQGAGPFQVGQTASFVLSVTNLAGSGVVLPGKAIIVTDHIPAALNTATAAGTNWSTNIVNGTLTATYTGSLPLNAGTPLPDIVISGQLGNAAVPTLNNAATVFTPDDSNQENNSSNDSITVAPLPNLSISLTHQGTGCVINGIETYTLSVSNAANAGPVLSGPLTVTANIPADIGGLSATASSGWNVTANGNTVTATYSGGYPVAIGATLPPITITGALSSPSSASLQATATVSLANDSNPDNNSTSDTITICPPDLAIVKSHQGTGQFQIGQDFSFVLTVSNSTDAGPVFTGHSITVSDQVPAGLSNAIAVGTNWSTNIVSGTLTATYTGSLPVATGATLSPIVLSGQLADGSVPHLINTASVSTLGDSNPTNNSSTDSVPVVNRPDLVSSLTHEGTGCNPAAAVNYTLVVSNVGDNSGPVLSGPITATFTIPNNLSNPVVTAGTDWQVSNSGADYTLTYSGSYPVNPGTSLASVTIAGNATGNSLAMNATVNTDTDSDHSNDSTSDTITICAPDLAIVKSHQGSGPFQVGQNFSFVLAVSNGPDSGPVFTGNSIIVTDHLPNGLSNPIATGTNWTTDITNGTLTATYAGTLPLVTGTSLPGIVVSGQLVDVASPTLSNTATVSTPDDSNTINDSSTDIVPIVARPDLVLSLFHGERECNRTYTVSDTLTVTDSANAGPVLASQPIIIHIPQPHNLTNVNLTATVPLDWQLSHNIDQSWTATYNGSYPLASGHALSTLTMTGDATTYSPSISATVTTPYDTNTDHTTKTDIIAICSPDLAITKTHSDVGPFQVGQSVNFMLSVSDVAGSGPVLTGDTITVTDHLPAGLVSPVANASSGWTKTISGGVLTATYTGPLPIDPGTTLPSIQLSGQLTNAALSSLSNTATVNVPDDSNPDNNSSTDTFPVIPTPDLSLVVTNPIGCTHMGKTASYSLQVSNAANAGEVLPNGPVTVSIPIPANLSNVTISGAWQGPSGPINGGSTVTMTYAGSYPIAASATLPLIIVSGTLTTAANTIAISGTVNTPTDTNESNNTGSGSISMCGADLTITKVHQGTGPFIVGNTVNYILKVSLAADSDPILDNPITVTDLLPAGLSSVVWSGNDWTFTTTNGTLTATYSGPYPLAVDSVLPSIAISGQLNATALPILFNTATVNMPGDSNPNNNSSVDQLPVQVAPDLRLHITSPTNCVRHSNKASFTFSVSNDKQAGPIITPIMLSFSIPSGLDKVTFSGSDWQWHKNGSTITVYYVGHLPVSSGQSLGLFKMTGVVTKPANGKVGFSATVTVDNDSHTTNNISYGKLNVCSRLGIGNGGTSSSGNNPGGNTGNNNNSGSHSSNSDNSTNNNSGSHSSNNDNSTSGSHPTGSGSQGYPGLPPTGSDPERRSIM